jgi:hypothetical protein
VGRVGRTRGVDARALATGAYPGGCPLGANNDPQHADAAAWAERDEITRGAEWIGSFFNADDWDQAAREQELLLQKRAREHYVEADPRPYAPQEFSVVQVPERKYGV